ncbi:beta strand repeat-containing protein [Arcobacter aquimarinus]|uniref:beta strand repeat-containing protein n=1 Tax=Arcobacter aquimarinus TaxID=1315211 RepID=UPI003BAEE62D
MATIAGTVQSLANGTFHAKDENGNIRTLKEGDTIYENDTIYGDDKNSSSSKIEVLLSGNDVIVLSEGQKQLIDSSLIETAFGTEELFFTRESLDLKADEYGANANVVSDLRDAQFADEVTQTEEVGAFAEANNTDITEEETAEGQEEAEDETTGNAEFQARDGNATNIESDLRNAQFKARTQVFIDRSAFENESEDRLTTINNIDRPSYTNPPVTSIVTPTNPTPPPTITPPVTETPVVIIGNLSVNDVSTYESDGFLIFTVTLDRPVSTPITFDYVTSPLTATNNGIDYTDVKGTITIPAGSTNITIRVPVTDDYLSDNGETMKITISNVVGNANITKPEGIGTILDNPVNNPSNGTPGIPTEPGGYGQEDTVYAIITGAITVNEGNTTTYTVKLVDKDGNAVVVTNATTVTVKYTNITTQDGDTQFNNNNTINVTIPANDSSNTFTVASIDDYIADNGEKYNVAITKVDTNEFENVVIGDKNGNNKDVTTEILDNSRPNTPNDLTDDNVEPTQDIILIKLFAADENGNVLKDGNGNYLLANEAEEGTNANYIAYAFENGTTIFNDSTKFSIQTGTVNISFQNDTATGASTKTLTDGSQDFNNTPKTSVSIGQSFSTEVFKDLASESTEKYKVVIDSNSYNGNYESVKIDTNPVTTTIHDEKLFVKIEPITDVANEGANLKYKIVIVNKDGEEVKVPTGKSITVDLNYEGNTSKQATENTDYTPVTSVTISAGTSYTEFEIVTKDDYYAEGDEGLKITINNIDNSSNAFENIVPHTTANGAPSNKITTTGTIKDNPAKIEEPTIPLDPNNPDNPDNGDYGQEDTIYAIITGTQTIKEGDTSTNYTVKLVDKDGNTVTPTKDTKITVTYNNITTQNGDTQYDNSDEIEVTILANTSEITFTVETKDDVYKDDGEQFNLTITDIQNTGEFENVKIGDKDGNQKNVISTIKDNTTPGTETNIDDVKIVLVAVPSATTTIANITDGDGKLIITNTNETPEGGNLYYMAVAVDNDGKPVSTQGGTVTINYGTTTDNTDKDATAGTDYDNTTVVSTTLGTVFSVNAKDDYYAEGDENFTVKITDLTNSPYESPSIDTSKDTVTSTIKDNPAKVEQPDTGTGNDNPTDGNYGKDDTVYVKITQAPSTIEGGNLVHTVTLVDKNGDPVTVPAGQTVTVDLTYTVNSGNFTESDLSTIIKSVTITGGNSSVNFTNVTKDDFTSEGDEIYNVTISSVTQSGAFENVAIHTDKTTTGTIKDGITLGTPVNASVDEDNFDVTDDNTTITDTKSLGIQKPNNPDNNYTLSFDETATKIYQGDFTSTTDYGLSSLKAGGQTIHYQTIGNKIIGYIGVDVGNGAVANSNKVFEIVLNKDSGIASGTTTKDSYTYTQYKNIDHPISGDSTIPTNDDDLTFEFGFKITDQGQTSNTVNFKVKVNDSLPINANRDVEVNEDNSLNIVISPESFKDGEIQIRVNGYDSNNGNDGYITLNTTNNQTIRVTDPNDDSIEIGTLTNNGDGTVTFEPDEDYSNYNAKPWFEYAVSDFDGDTAAGRVNIDVKPVADAPTITISTPTMIEDNTNTNEGAHQVALGLTKPSLSKDQTDENTTNTGDKPEKNGEITLTFTNGDKVTGAKIFKADGTTQVGADITTANQTFKIVIVTVSGDSSTIDYTYHHKDITASNPSGAIYLTQAEYESLKIQHAEDNDTDIKIGISVTSYELDDNDKPLNATDSTYADKTNANLSETTEETMTVKINPATDDISLVWNNATGGTISQTTNANDTFTFTAVDEGDLFTTPIDLKSLLTKTSGTETFDGSKADLDGSEKRTYTIEGIPEGTIVTLGGQVAVANAGGEATIVFNNTNNQAADPEFSLKLPEHYSGTISNAKITLSVQDKGADSGDTPSTIKTAEVYFNVVVNPIADIATIQVSQSVGFEDAGRDGGNTIAKSDTINADGAGGIPLNIKVSSDDKDGSESFNVKIEDIPSNAVIYYDGMVVNQSPAGTVTINNFDNAKSLIFIPPHNDDRDYILKVSAQTVDNNGTTTNTSAWSSPKDIEVIVKNVADAPVGTGLNANISVNEDNKLNLKDIYTTPANLASYDGSEELTVKIDLPAGFTVDSGSPYYIENGMYVVKASDIKAGHILINVPENFSGSASFDLTYVTTEKAGENDSKTWDKQTVNIFVNPIADDVSVATSSTIYEDADGNANKINITPSLTDTDGSESITSVKILASDVPAGYELYLDSAMTQSISSTLNGLYYELTPEQADSIYAKNTTLNDADSSDNFDLTVVYTVKDTATGTSDVTADFTHTHTVNVQAVTDAPSLNIGTIAQESGNVTVNGTTVTVNQEDSQFKVPVTTTSSDTDGSETVQKIVISGVPMGVEVVGATYYGYSGSEHNGIWVITAPADSTLDADGALQDITFKVNQGANFDDRYITITTYTQDVNAEIKSASQTIHIERTYPDGVNPGTPADLDLTVQAASITEDTEFNLAEALVVGGTDGNGGAVITISDIPEGSTITGADYSYEKTEAGVTKTYYVVVGNGNATDMNTQLSNVKITTPKDMNSFQEGSLQGDFTFTANIATYYNGAFDKGNTVSSTQTILPLTDAMTVAIDANNINEDGTSNLSITLSNPSDGTKTELIGNSITIKVTENWLDSNANGEGTKGTLTQTGTDYIINDNNDGTYTITKTNGTPFTVDTPITGLQYTPATNRDGNVTFEVSVQNKETGSNLILDSKGSTNISVTPVIDVELNASVVTAVGTEDAAVTVGSTTLANPVKLEITAGTFTDGSEKIGNIILDEVPNGFTVWYKVGSDLVMATNIGKSGTGTFDLTPNISGDADVHRNKWLVPASADGSMPEVYINAPTNWSGEFDFKAKFSISEQNLSTVTPIEVDVEGKIEAVADGVTIDPTLTFGDAFSWVSLNLNANMKDVDGSETMSLELTGLNESAQFRLKDGTALNATLDGTTWKLDGIAFDQINNIELLHDKSVNGVSVTAKTVDTDGTNTDESNSSLVKTFDLKLSDVSGNFKLDSGISLDFDKIDAITTAKNLSEIDLSEAGANDLLNLSLTDIVAMTDSSNELKISGTNEDEVSFKGTGWSKTTGSGADAGFDIYSNSNDTSVKVKVEQNIQDQII